MTTLGEPLLLLLAGAVGSVVRYLAGRALDRGWHTGTLVVNLLGSALLGGLVGAEVPPTVLVVLGVGLCGGLTTYSAFAVQTSGLLLERRWPRAAAYVLVTVGGCLLASAAGWALAGAMVGRS